MMQRAIDAEVSRFFVPAIDSTYFDAMLDLEKSYPKNIFLMMGLHPTHVNENVADELAFVKKWLDKKQFYAVGEIGIDLYWDKTFVKEQQIAFDTQINWALKLNLPIVIHSRESFGEIFEILENYKNTNLKGVFHSFSGNLEQANKAMELGFLLGINGIVTFKNSGLDKTLAEVPLEKLILETDAPYLAPVPKRGKRNESSYLKYTAQKIAEIYQTKIERVAEITSHNARNLFNL
jgi:TatD DNase family protein